MVGIVVVVGESVVSVVGIIVVVPEGAVVVVVVPEGAVVVVTSAVVVVFNVVCVEDGTVAVMLAVVSVGFSSAGGVLSQPPSKRNENVKTRERSFFMISPPHDHCTVCKLLCINKIIIPCKLSFRRT